MVFFFRLLFVQSVGVFYCPSSRKVCSLMRALVRGGFSRVFLSSSRERGDSRGTKSVSVSCTCLECLSFLSLPGVSSSKRLCRSGVSGIGEGLGTCGTRTVVGLAACNPTSCSSSVPDSRLDLFYILPSLFAKFLGCLLASTHLCGQTHLFIPDPLSSNLGYRFVSGCGTAPNKWVETLLTILRLL
jgi:hypothetical protein